MEKVTLSAELRGVGRHAVRELRAAERTPVVIYGAHQAPITASVLARDLRQALHRAGAGLLSLTLAGQAPIQALAREVQHDPISHRILHVDFQAVSMTEKLRLHVPIAHEGVAPALSTSDHVLVRGMDQVEIECLPADIPAHIVANIATLKGPDDEVLVKDLIVPAGVRILSDSDHVVFSIAIARSAAEEEVTTEAPAADSVEVVAKGKAKEGAEEVVEEKGKK
jgi:large subunit ribosomal protein L25